MIPHSSTICLPEIFSFSLDNLLPEIMSINGAAKPLTAGRSRRWLSRNIFSRNDKHSNRGSANIVIKPSVHRMKSTAGFATSSVDELKTVAKKCDELEQTELYQKSFQLQKTIKLKNGSIIEQTVKWFNQVTVGKKAYTNVLRFVEVIKNPKGEVLKYFKTEWLTSTKITRNNCFTLPQRGRMRADHEDIHNTLKNRGFDAKHDYARVNPHTCLIWKLLMFVAFWIFELFGFTSLARIAKGSRSWIDFAKDLLSDLAKVPWEKIALSPSLQKERIQFRFVFNP